MKLSQFLPATVFSPAFKRVALTACLGLVSLSASANTIISFESSEGFNLNSNPQGGTTGWYGSGNAGAANYLYVTSAKAYDGTQSVAAKNGATDYFFTRTADGNSLYDLNSTKVEFYFSHDTDPSYTPAVNDQIARWEVYYSNAPTEGSDMGYRAIMELRYTESGYSIYLRGTGTNAFHGSATRYIQPESNFDLASWNKISISLDYAPSNNTKGYMRVEVNGVALDAPVELSRTVFTEDSRINALRINTPKLGVGTSYYDYFVLVIPEPSSTMMTMGVLGGGWLLRQGRLRRRKEVAPSANDGKHA